jgi:ribosome biogenesis GTPase A
MNNQDLVKHTKINVRDWDKVKSPDIIVFNLIKEYPEAIEKYYSIKSDDFESFIEKLGRKNNFLTKGNKIDIDRTCRKVLRDWQEGRIRL